MTDPIAVIRALLYEAAGDVRACDHCNAVVELIVLAPDIVDLAITHQDGCQVLDRYKDEGAHG